MHGQQNGKKKAIIIFYDFYMDNDMQLSSSKSGVFLSHKEHKPDVCQYVLHNSAKALCLP